jgi:endonuclease/exonuclease/phosphatase family metal-dependent hydrolase
MFNSSYGSGSRAFSLLVVLMGAGLAGCPASSSRPDFGPNAAVPSRPVPSPETVPTTDAPTQPTAPTQAQPTADDPAKPVSPPGNSPTNTAATPTAAAQGDSLTLGVWNMEWLSETENAGNAPRSASDYARLASYLPTIDADVMVLQEVESLVAVRRVFAEPEWNAHIADQPSNQRVAVVWRDGIQLQVLPDYEALNTSRLREGVDFEVTLPGESAPTVRVLGVHLKSGCFSDDYRTAGSDACVKLATQVPLLEAWIDARATEGVPYMVVGDFNRRLQAADPFWLELDDQQPAGADLEMTYGAARPLCWNSRYDQFVDHLVLGGPAIPLFVADSFREFVYPAADDAFRERLSDHCPLLIDLATP